MRGSLQLTLAAALLLPTLAAGCATLLPAGPESRLEFACAVLDPGQAERVIVHAWVAEGIDLDTAAAHAALQAELQGIGGRSGGVSLRTHDGPEAPRDGWDGEEVRRWTEELPFEFGDEVHFHVLWVETLRFGRSVLVAAPGVVVVSDEAIREGATRMEADRDDVARAVLLHAAGHALGAVNQGIPVQDPDVRHREGPAGHDPDPASVLHASWEDAATMAWAANATYDHYGPAVHADWDAAVQPGGVCAA